MESCIGLGTMCFGTKIEKQTSFEILDYYHEILNTANNMQVGCLALKGAKVSMYWVNG